MVVDDTAEANEPLRGLDCYGHITRVFDNNCAYSISSYGGTRPSYGGVGIRKGLEAGDAGFLLAQVLRDDSQADATILRKGS